MNKKDLSERDICTKFITPALRNAGWDEQLQIREEVSFTKGRIIVRGKLVSRGKGKRADYILYYKPNIPIAVIEVKDNRHSVGDGMQQALDYALTLDIRITGGDAEGQAELGNFIDPEARYPVLVTTSRLLSTGVDAQTCRLIVLDRAVGSMTEFKQIVGRGTRVHEDTQKYYFTLIDFRGATSHFADPEFDGEPVQIYAPREEDLVAPPDEPPSDDEATDAEVGEDSGDYDVLVGGTPNGIPTGGGRREKIYVDGVTARIIAERVEYLDEQGKLVTESLRDFTRKALHRHFASLDDFLRRWGATERKQALVDELAGEGLPLDVICATTVGNWGISASKLKEVQFPLPPLAEQHRIVAKVNELMALCDRLEASLTTADSARRCLLDALLHEALAPAMSDDSIATAEARGGD
ncbi:hypothetical protein [Thiocystis violacea]|uniref:hypothetical protein n=1 Tax=Thiocystis violacea TaxID=13725 RepID=UPI001906F8E4|nr:hypothetical protein [Thiocystis violacea]